MTFLSEQHVAPVYIINTKWRTVFKLLFEQCTVLHNNHALQGHEEKLFPLHAQLLDWLSKDF